MMKNKWMITTALTSVLLVGYLLGGSFSTPTPQAQAASSDQHRIAASGTGSVTITPDVVYVRVGVETKGKTVAEAQQKNAKASEAVKTTLKNAGVADKDIKTVQFNTYPEYTYNDKQVAQLVGYTVQNIINVTYRNVNQVGQLLDKLTAAGANRIDSISFGTEKRDQYEGEALQRAVQDAKKKADSMATAAGVKVKGVVSIVEQGATQYAPETFGATFDLAQKSAAPTTSISVGELEIRANVNVVYEF